MAVELSISIIVGDGKLADPSEQQQMLLRRESIGIDLFLRRWTL
jgi:hypothetical protein